MSEESRESEPSFGLVMPFVSAASKGGPFDDASYAAGWAMGALSERLKAGPVSHEEAVRRADAAQADLVAMDAGYRCELAEVPPEAGGEEWMWGRFTRMRID